MEMSFRSNSTHGYIIFIAPTTRHPRGYVRAWPCSYNSVHGSSIFCCTSSIHCIPSTVHSDSSCVCHTANSCSNSSLEVAETLIQRECDIWWLRKVTTAEHQCVHALRISWQYRYGHNSSCLGHCSNCYGIRRSRCNNSTSKQYPMNVFVLRTNRDNMLQRKKGFSGYVVFVVDLYLVQTSFIDHTKNPTHNKKNLHSRLREGMVMLIHPELQDLQQRPPSEQRQPEQWQLQFEQHWLQELHELHLQTSPHDSLRLAHQSG